MADIKDIRTPKVLNLDASPSLQKEIEAFYIKNLTDKLVQDSAGNFNLKEGLLVPFLSNTPACVSDILPTDGSNRCIGSYESILTNEVYHFNYNSANHHGIYRIDGDGCTQVYLGSCLNFSPEEKHAIAEHRVHLAVVSDSNDPESRNIFRKFLIFTDGKNPLRFIDVETSIATNSFNATDFPYWQTFYPFCDPCEYIELPTRPPYDCPKVELVPFNEADANLPNRLIGETFQFRYRYILTDGRITTWSPISPLIYVPQSICDNGRGDSRCIKLTLNAGSALVEKIQIAFRNCNGDASNPDTPTDWFLYDTINKYDSCDTDDDYWTRAINLNDYCIPDDECACAGTFDQVTYSWDMSAIEFPKTTAVISYNEVDYTSPLDNTTLLELVEWLNGLNIGDFILTGTTISVIDSEGNVYGDIILNSDGEPETVTPDVSTETITCYANTFDYIFCANKQCIVIDIKDTDRDYDDVPRKAFALTPINNKIATANNLKQFNPVNCSELDKFNFGFDFTDNSDCNVPFYKVSGWFVIHNLSNSQNVAVVKSGDNVFFGGYCNPAGGYDFQAGTADPYGTGYGQALPSGTGGFIVYANKYVFTRTVQKQYNSNTGVLSDFGTDSNLGDSYANLTAGIYLVQYFEFNLPRGNYSFRIASQSALPSNFEKTSTYTIGFVPQPANDYDPLGAYSAGDFTIEKEAVISVCDHDVKVNDVVGTLIVADLTDGRLGGTAPFVLTGYLTDKNGQPVELSFISPEGGGETIDEYTQWTDHNGFYFLQWVPGDTPSNTTIDWNVDIAGNDLVGATWEQVNYPDKANLLNRMVSAEFEDCQYEDAYAILAGDITRCDGGGLENIPIAVKHTHIVYTDSTGHYEVHLRGYVNADNTRGFTNDSEDVVLIEQNLGCLLMGCGDDCNTCFDPIHLHDYADTDFTCDSTPFDEGTNEFDLFDQLSRGVKSGQKYLLGWALHDKNKRHTFIQHRDAYDLQIPFITNYPNNTPPLLFWQLTSLPIIPPEFQNAYISFYITLDPVLQWLQWAVSKVEFLDGQGNSIVDSSGNPISIGAVKMKISVEGLNNYNSENNFQTNTVFEFEKGDMVKFIDDGNGNKYNSELIDVQVTGSGLVTTPINPPAPDPLNNPALPDNPAQSFIIDYDSRLNGLSPGAWIEMYRPAPCEGSKFFYETCQTYPIIAGKIQIDCADAVIDTHYEINFFDTYLLRRAIPQPDSSGSPSVLNVSHPYEHHSPSDFCCTKCASIGRINVMNPYEHEVWHSDTIQNSDAIDYDAGIINGLSTFRSENSRNYNTQDFGDIVAIRAIRNAIVAICQRDYFMISVDYQLARVTPDGNITASSQYLGESNQKTKDKYGCDYDYPRTIQFIDSEGFVTFLDTREGAQIICNYTSATPLTEGVQGYFYNKIKYVEKWNSQNEDKFIVHSGYDPLQKKILTTFVKFSTPTWYINDNNAPLTPSNETIIFDVINKAYRGFAAFAPEAYAKISAIPSGKQLITLINGKPYFHNSIDVTTYLNFYGIQTNKFVGVTFNNPANVVKRHMNISIQCAEQAWRVDKIETERNQTSYIPIPLFREKEEIWYAAYLMADNSPVKNGLLAIADGNTLVGIWIKCLLAGDVTKASEYCELKNITSFSFPSNRTNK